MTQANPTISEPKWSHRITTNTLIVIYLLSGACSLIDQVVWSRLLKLIMGNTVYASSIVVSVFMAGLALGAFLMGKRVARVKAPLRVYAIIELAITAIVLSSPWQLEAADIFYLWLWQTFHPTPALLTFFQILVSALILLVPTTLMGSTLPLLASFVASVEKNAGAMVGRLYALNTLGAALGCFLAGFVLIRVLGVMGTLSAAAILNLLVAAGGYFLHVLSKSRVPGNPDAENAGPPESLEVTQVCEAAHANRGFPLVAIAFFLSGFTCIAYELMWMRSIVHSLGAFTFVFSSVLTVYLLGNVIGTFVGNRLVRQTDQPGLIYAALFFVLGVCGILYMPWLHLCNHGLLSWATEGLNELYWKRNHFWLMVEPLAKCTVLFLAPSILMGMGFPLMLQAWVNRMHGVGRSTGICYAVNTSGAVLGGLLTGFVAIPWLGLQRSMLVLGLTVMWFAGIMWFTLYQPTAQRLPRRCLLLLIAGLISMNCGRIPKDLFLKTVALSDKEGTQDVVAVKEGVNTTVSIHQSRKNDDLFLYTSGTMVAGTSRGYRGDQKMLGHFPVLLNQHADSTLSVGYGTGESTTCLSFHRIGRVDCVEIAPEVVEMSKTFFKDLNWGDQVDQHVNLIYMDARNYLHLTQQRYDVIVSDCTSIRAFAENASLYTKDYFESAKRHLHQTGMFMSWIDTYSTESKTVVDSLIGTMLTVFPHVTLWYMTTEPAPFFVIVGSEQPQYFSLRHIDHEMSKSRVKESLAKINLFDAADVISCYVADETDLRRHLPEDQCNTDDRPLIEFCTDHRFGSFAQSREFYQTVRSESVYDHLDWTGVDKERKQVTLAALRKMRTVANHVLLAQTSTSLVERYRHLCAAAKLPVDNPVFLQMKRSAEMELFEKGVEKVTTEAYPAALQFAQLISKYDPESVFPAILKSQVALHQGNLQSAKDLAREAVARSPHDLAAQTNLWTILCAQNEFEEAYRLVMSAAESRHDSKATPKSDHGKPFEFK